MSGCPLAAFGKRCAHADALGLLQGKKRTSLPPPPRACALVTAIDHHNE
jgi:hypothetical protein